MNIFIVSWSNYRLSGDNIVSAFDSLEKAKEEAFRLETKDNSFEEGEEETFEWNINHDSETGSDYWCAGFDSSDVSWRIDEVELNKGYE